MKTLHISIAQITCIDGAVEQNLSHAYDLAREAHANGSELLLFPEFLTQGYRLTPDLWDSAELFDGPSTSLLSEASARFGMYMGTSFLEAKAGHFYNTFAFSNPSGKITGVVRKRFPSMWEAYFFKGFDGDHVFETDFGRVGVGICFDNHTYKVASLIAKGYPDLVLMPHSYCTPTVPNKLYTLHDIERLKKLPVNVAHLYNGWLGVPVVLCNKSGDWDSPVPNRIFGSPSGFKFSGRSSIIDANGNTLAELGEEEGIGYGQISIHAGSCRKAEIPKYSRYIYPGPAGREITRLMELQGYLSYRFSRKRKEKAKFSLKSA